YAISFGAFHKSAKILTHRFSNSAVCGYSDLSMAFFSSVSAISNCASSSIYVWQKVAKFCLAFPSSIN
ncbi:hypothetical protein NT03LS_2730a, partial [Listeria seeligeri FSL N1-067]